MKYFHPAGSRASADATVCIEPDGQNWKHTGLTVVSMKEGERRAMPSAGRETLVVPLAGGVDVEIDGIRFELSGRPSVWHPTDVLYIPVGADAVLIGTGPAEIALPWAVAERVFPVQHLTADAVAPELRGAGICSREVRNYGTPGVLMADRLIACEVLTPAGNWSSYPPHKHDTAGPGESELEEIYFYRVAPAPTGTPGFGLQRVYASAAGGIDVTEEVRSNDVILIPFGYHGPSIAAPGHDLYYLNVMAGPDAGENDRAWRISDDPEHAWIRETWADQPIDNRLPFGE